MTQSFRSYIDLDEYVNNGSPAGGRRTVANLLPGETVVASAADVLLYLPLSERPSGVRGTLIVTNFRLSFLDASNEQDKSQTAASQWSLLLGRQDVCLMNVDTVSQLLSSAGKTRLLPPHSTVSTKIKGLQIRCKDFQLFTFSFKLSSLNEDRNVINALLVLCYPRSSRLLFTFSYRDVRPPTAALVSEQTSPADWQAELHRTGSMGWRVSQANEQYQMCHSLPEVLVVPKGLFDADLVVASGHYVERRPPVWCWGSAQGAAIVRSAYIHPDLKQSGQERLVLDGIRSSHPFLREPKVLDVGAACPTVEELQESYSKLRLLCSPDSVQAFVESDSRFLTQLAGSGWMAAVAQCLAAALRCVDVLTDTPTVCVLTECSGRDLTAAVSCLAQLLLEPYARTLAGFERLVQREWVLLGHPFQERLGLLYQSQGKKGPVFLLFLDCVHQLVEQFPDRFEFTDTYLVALWDSLFLSTFDTFLFDCQKERDDARLGKESGIPLPSRPVWDWSRQLGPAQQELFSSPLYQCRQELSLPAACDRLRPATSAPALAFWSLAFCRWLPSLHVVRGGRPADEARQRQLLERLRVTRARLLSARDGVVVRRPAAAAAAAAGAATAQLPGSLAPFAVAREPSRLLCVSAGFVSSLLRMSIVTADDEGASTLRRQQYGS